jgi:hypothetical protein
MRADRPLTRASQMGVDLHSRGVAPVVDGNLFKKMVFLRASAFSA